MFCVRFRFCRVESLHGNDRIKARRRPVIQVKFNLGLGSRWPHREGSTVRQIEESHFLSGDDIALFVVVIFIGKIPDPPHLHPVNLGRRLLNIAGRQALNPVLAFGSGKGLGMLSLLENAVDAKQPIQ